MSYSDQKELPNTGWFDSESDFPGILLVNSTPKLVNMSCAFANQIQVRALDFWDSSATDLAPNKGTPVGHVPLEGIQSSKGENFLDTPIH